MIKYYVLIDGEQKGPFTKSQMTNMWNAGKITSETLYWFEGIGSEWLPIDDMFEPAPLPTVSRIAPRIEKVPDPTPRRSIVWSAIKMITVATWVFAIIGFVYYQATKEPRVSYTAPRPVVENSAWDGSVSQVKRYIEKNAKDPVSVQYIEWSKVAPTAEGNLVNVKYRAKNSFGGYVVEEAIFILSSSGEVIKMVPKGT